MNAKQARAATSKILAKKQREAEENASFERKKQEERDEWSRTAAYPSFMEDVVHAVAEAISQGKEHAVASTMDKLVADLAVKKLVEDGYDAHMKSVDVPENREYGSSGEGMHDACTTHVIHINWGRKDRCRACDEVFERSGRRW